MPPESMPRRRRAEEAGVPRRRTSARLSAGGRRAAPGPDDRRPADLRRALQHEGAQGDRRGERRALSWLAPTRVTALVFVLPIAIWGVLARVREDLALFLLLLAVELPFRLWRALGVSVGRHTDF